MARSKYAEMIEDEATKAEAEDDALADEDEADDADDLATDDESLDALDTEPEPEYEPPSAEALAAGLEREFGRRVEALRELFGPDLDAMTECPRCAALGYVAADAPLEDPKTDKCPECNGFGVFLTQSHVDNHLTRQCPTCLGNGYVNRPEPVVFQPTAPYPVPSVTGGPPQPQTYVNPQSTVQIPPMPQYDPSENVWRDPNTGAIIGNGAGSSAPRAGS